MLFRELPKLKCQWSWLRNPDIKKIIHYLHFCACDQCNPVIWLLNRKQKCHLEAGRIPNKENPVLPRSLEPLGWDLFQFLSYFQVTFLKMASPGLKALRFPQSRGSHENFAHTHTGTHCHLHADIHPQTHTPGDTQTRPKTESKLHKAWSPKMQKYALPFTEASICLIQTPTVKLLLSPDLCLPPLGTRDRFFSLLKNIDFKNKHSCISKQAVLFELHILISILLSIFF